MLRYLIRCRKNVENLFFQSFRITASTNIRSKVGGIYYALTKLDHTVHLAWKKIQSNVHYDLATAHIVQNSI